jgi:hypothetical protein
MIIGFYFGISNYNFIVERHIKELKVAKFMKCED